MFDFPRSARLRRLARLATRAPAAGLVRTLTEPFICHTPHPRKGLFDIYAQEDSGPFYHPRELRTFFSDHPSLLSQQSRK